MEKVELALKIRQPVDERDRLREVLERATEALGSGLLHRRRHWNGSWVCRADCPLCAVLTDARSALSETRAG